MLIGGFFQVLLPFNSTLEPELKQVSVYKDDLTFPLSTIRMAPKGLGIYGSCHHGIKRIERTFFFLTHQEQKLRTLNKVERSTSYF